MFFSDLVRIFVGIEAEEKNAGGKGYTFPLFLFGCSAVSVDIFMACVLKLVFVRCFRRLGRTCCTGWIFQCGYYERNERSKEERWAEKMGSLNPMAYSSPKRIRGSSSSTDLEYLEAAEFHMRENYGGD